MKRVALLALDLAKNIQSSAVSSPLVSGPKEVIGSETVIASSFVLGTRGYIEKVTAQINACYSAGCYDSCAVMMRRLLETSIIEVYEHHKCPERIQKNGDFMYLSDLIAVIMNDKAWNLSRNTKQALPKLKDIGDKSAHSRRFNAHRSDIDDLKNDFRTVIQELIYLASLK